jgi:hypothetical protein
MVRQAHHERNFFTARPEPVEGRGAISESCFTGKPEDHQSLTQVCATGAEESCRPAPDL